MPIVSKNNITQTQTINLSGLLKRLLNQEENLKKGIFMQQQLIEGFKENEVLREFFKQQLDLLFEVQNTINETYKTIKPISENKDNVDQV